MTVAIRAMDLVKSYAPEVRALDGVSLEVNTGEVLVVMGPSGSGKSTLIRTFNGLEPLDSGELDVLGLPLDASHDNCQEGAQRSGQGRPRNAAGDPRLWHQQPLAISATFEGS